MALRDFNWLDVPFGLFVAGIVALASITVATTIMVVGFGREMSEALDTIAVVTELSLLVGMFVLARLQPGPGRIIEKPLNAALAFLTPPFLVGIMTVAGAFPSETAWYIPVLFYGFLPSTFIGFAAFFALFSEASRFRQPKQSWPIDRPASLGQGGVRSVPLRQMSVYAGLERGGPEEERPDTFVRMKTKE